MKALRYLLVAMVIMLAVLPADAQFTKINSVEGCTTFGQVDRQYQFTSTSVILMPERSAGLTEGGAFTTCVSSGKPASFGPRRNVGGGGTTEDDDEPEDPGEPFPIGDGVWVLLLLAAGFAFGKWRYQMMLRRRKATA